MAGNRLPEVKSNTRSNSQIHKHSDRHETAVKASLLASKMSELQLPPLHERPLITEFFKVNFRETWIHKPQAFRQFLAAYSQEEVVCVLYVMWCMCLYEGVV